MSNWIFAPSKNLVLVGVSSFFFVYGSATTMHDVSQTDVAPSMTESRAPIIDSALVRSVRFQQLVNVWKSERRATSSIAALAMADPYQRIIGMGVDTIPLIIGQLISEGDDPDQWFWALRVLTGTDPVSDADRGDFTKMAQLWIAWARAEGYAG